MTGDIEIAYFDQFQKFALRKLRVNHEDHGTHTSSHDFKNFPIMSSTILHQRNTTFSNIWWQIGVFSRPWSQILTYPFRRWPFDLWLSIYSPHGTL